VDVADQIIDEPKNIKMGGCDEMSKIVQNVEKLCPDTILGTFRMFLNEVRYLRSEPITFRLP
jgi:hypothetical protein